MPADVTLRSGNGISKVTSMVLPALSGAVTYVPFCRRLERCYSGRRAINSASSSSLSDRFENSVHQHIRVNRFALNMKAFLAQLSQRVFVGVACHDDRCHGRKLAFEEGNNVSTKLSGQMEIGDKAVELV